MTAFLIILHVLVCFFLILTVLLQPGARGGVGAAFGGAGGQTVFGGRGANTFLAKLTASAAVVFMLTSIALSYFVSRGTSVMERHGPAPVEAAPQDAGTGDASDAGEGGPEAPAPAGDAAAGDAGTDAPPAEQVPPAGEAPPAP